MPKLDLGIVGFSHVGFAVPTVEAFAETWGSVLGIETWSVHEESAKQGVFVDGATPGPLRVKVAFARAGGLAIELIETIEGETCHSRTSDRVAPGLHHLAFWVRDSGVCGQSGSGNRPYDKHGSIFTNCKNRQP